MVVIVELRVYVNAASSIQKKRFCNVLSESASLEKIVVMHVFATLFAFMEVLIAYFQPCDSII
jgi:hypothetical protein